MVTDKNSVFSKMLSLTTVNPVQLVVRLADVAPEVNVITASTKEM